MTDTLIHLGNIDQQPQNRDWLRIMAKQHESEGMETGNLAMTYLDPDDLDASWEALQRLIRGAGTDEQT